MSLELPSASPDPGPPPTKPVERRGATSASGYTLLHLDEATADGSAFGERKGRFGGSIATSVGTHALLILLFWGLTLLPATVAPTQQPPAFDITQLVFENIPGPGGGGGGGGNESKEPPAKVQTKPADKIAVPVAKPTPQTAPKEIPKETPPQVAMLNIPVKPMDAGQIPQIGTLDGPSAPPTDSQGSGKGGGTGTGTGAGSGPGDGSGQGPGTGGGMGGGVYQIGNGVSSPEILYKTQPQYTAEAMRAKIQGMALLSGIVAPDGTLQQIQIARSLDGTFGLDQEAIKCVRQWRFRPGMRFGKPVAVAVTIEVAFNLR